MLPTREEVTEILKKKWDERKLEELFPEAFIFGSLINRGGRHFMPAGTMGSDIDFLMVFNPEISEAPSRTKTLTEFKVIAKELEYEVCQLLKRTDKVFSFLPVTDYEVYHCIHKGFDPKIFTLNIFFDVLKGELSKNGLADYIDFDFHLESIEAFTAMRNCQKMRNMFLSVDMLGEEVVEPFDGPGEVPKEIMRTFALLNYIDMPDGALSDRTDLEKGFDFLKRCLKENVYGSMEVSSLAEKVSGRSFIRSESEPLTPNDLLLLTEISFDEARRRVRKSVREVIDRSM